MFATEDEPVYEVYVNLIAPSSPVTFTITLFDQGMVPVHRESVDLKANRKPEGGSPVLPAAVRARR